MDENKLEKIYQENLEEKMMLYLVETQGISYEQSMEIYYRSKLSAKIQEGREGIQYLDYKVLVEILKETEPELFDFAVAERNEKDEKDECILNAHGN